MDKKVYVSSLSILLLFAWGCTSGKDNWLIYEPQPNSIPPFGYRGHKTFKGEDRNKSEIDKKRSILGETYEGQTPSQIDTTLQTTLTKGKPVVTELDDARLLLLLPQTQYNNHRLLCEISDKPITRQPTRVFPHPNALSSYAEDKDTNRLMLFFCDLQTGDRGGKIVEFVVSDQTQATETTKGEPLARDGIEVRAMYRFRVMTGPAYTSLSKKRNSYTAITDNQGQKVVSSNVDGNPVDLPLLLKIYWAPEGRDIYADPPCWKAIGARANLSNSDIFVSCLKQLNPVLGFNALDNPFNNLYAGLSWETFRGLDIVAGFHWSKVKTLTGGFTDGAPITGDEVPTKDKYLQGWFLGINLDLGVAGTWLSKSAIGMFK